MKSRLAIVRGRALKYRIRRHPRARKWKVTVSEDQGVVVTVPRGQTLAEVDSLMKEWEEWLEEQVNKTGVWEGPILRSLATDSEIHWMGRPRKLKISALDNSRSRNKIHFCGDQLLMELNPLDVLTPRPALIRFLKKQAKEDLLWRVEYWSCLTGLVAKKIIVGERKTRWGSCSRNGTLSFCYRLVMAPPNVIDSVVVHELCHLKHHNHGAGFYALLESILPKYHQTTGWLRDNARHLEL
ncbi:MAG: M48 family metallopeptidase [bacterium]|nr:M48 family metallopeptidase [bacterium]